MKDTTKIGIGEIPLINLCRWLDDRGYSKELVIQYIKDVYNQDVSIEINELIEGEIIFFGNKIDIFAYFDEKYPPKRPDDGTREYFKWYGKNRYLKFYSNFYESGDVVFDEIINVAQHAEHIHHILPLDYGGKSNPKNLIGVIEYFHSLLHLNPLQHIEKCCYMAVDYLKHLHYWNVPTIVAKYNIPISHEDKGYVQETYKFALKKEMELFYNKLLQEFPYK